MNAVNSVSSSRGIRLCSVIYLILAALTLITWAMGVSGMNGIVLSLLLLGLSALKAQLIGNYFMGLKQVAGWWQWVISGWLLVTGSLISVAFYLGASA